MFMKSNKETFTKSKDKVSSSMDKTIVKANILKKHAYKYIVPLNLGYFWNWGFILIFFISTQVVSGLFLSFNYTPDADKAFDSIQIIVRDVNYGWFFKNWHMVGASFIFISMYIHIGRGMYYRRYIRDNMWAWYSGMLLFIIIMAISFVGYVLPWGQMSYWGTTVIVNFFSAIPYFGAKITQVILGGPVPGDVTLKRFYSIHFLLGLFSLALIILHIYCVHISKFPGNQSDISEDLNRDGVPLTPYYAIKDITGFLPVFIIFIYFVTTNPDFFGDRKSVV